MKFRFYAVLHNMKLDSTKTKGKRINLDDYRARITNGSREFEKILQNPETNERIGFHSANEFLADNTTYVYIDGELIISCFQDLLFEVLSLTISNRSPSVRALSPLNSHAV